MYSQAGSSGLRLGELKVDNISNDSYCPNSKGMFSLYNSASWHYDPFLLKLNGPSPSALSPGWAPFVVQPPRGCLFMSVQLGSGRQSLGKKHHHLCIEHRKRSMKPTIDNSIAWRFKLRLLPVMDTLSRIEKQYIPELRIYKGISCSSGDAAL